MKVPVILQYDSADCGAAALYSVAKAYSISSTISEIRNLLKISRVGSTLEELKNASTALGLKSLPIKIRSIKNSLELRGDEPTIKDVPTPFICLIDNSHWIVVEEINNRNVRIMDPSVGSISLELEALSDRWIHNDYHIVLAFENELPGLNFSPTTFNVKLVSNLVKAFVQNTYEHKNLLLLIATSSMFILLFQAIIPFLTQGLIDIGLTNYNGKLVLLFLIAQLCIFILSSISIFIHQYITVLLGKLININTVKNFISMLLNLPLSFYASINTGDILTRFNDIDRIELFFSRNFVSFIFSLISLLSYILLLYFFESYVFYLSIMLVFLYLSFNFMYMSKRVSLDYESFKITSDIEGQLIEAVSGMVDIRIYQSSKKRLAFFENILSQMIDLSKRETRNEKRR
jgi:ATP-binding cassette subfamily B protein